MTDVAVERPAATDLRSRVAWSTVLPLAIVMAYADGFWMTSLRGAVGAVERSRSPFVSWLRDSTLTLPLFVLAVLAAVTLGLRLFGTNRPRGRKALAAMLLIVAAGSLVGIAVVTASSAYDYVLQSNQILLMEAIHPMCTTGDCAGVQQLASLELQLRSIAYGSGILLLTNLIVVGWVVALRGGRIDLAKSRAVEPHSDDAAPDRAEGLQFLLVGVLVGTALVHSAVLASSLVSSPSSALYLSVVVVAELVAAIAVLMWPRRGTLRIAAIVSGTTFALGVMSYAAFVAGGRGTGLPTMAGPAGLATSLLELTALVIALVLLRDGAWLRRPPVPSSHVRWLAGLAVLALTVIGIAGSGLPGLDQYVPQNTTVYSTHQHSA